MSPRLKDPLFVNGDVDKPTANALNWLLAKLGALRVVKASSAQPAARQVLSRYSEVSFGTPEKRRVNLSHCVN